MRLIKPFGKSKYFFVYSCAAHERDDDFLDELTNLWTPLDFHEVRGTCSGAHGLDVDRLRVAADFWRAISECHGDAEQDPKPEAQEGEVKGRKRPEKREAAFAA